MHRAYRIFEIIKYEGIKNNKSKCYEQSVIMCNIADGLIIF